MGLPSDKPLTKVTLFLYDEDIEKLRRLEGYGWSAKIREVIHQWLKEKRINKFQTSLPPDQWRKLIRGSPEE